MLNIYESVSQNKRKSFFVVTAFTIFVFVAIYFIGAGINAYYGYDISPLGTMGFALILSGGMSFGSYYFSDKIILGISGAKEADRKEYFDFYTVAENLAIGSGLPKPKLFVINDSAPNAFATGRNPENAVICATTGLLQKLDRTELEGVIAHELSHVKNYDILLMSLVSVMVGTIALLGDWFFRARYFGGRRSNDEDNNGGLGAILIVVGIIFAILSPIIAQLIQLAISRRREFLADAGSVAITKQPSGLISALEKISQDQEPLEVANRATAHLYIINPIKNNVSKNLNSFSGLFNTHPPIAERIKALKEMS
jgi:heat shock protein HtpX